MKARAFVRPRIALGEAEPIPAVRARSAGDAIQRATKDGKRVERTVALPG